ncbi:hypothetical protein [Rhodococcus sp. 11-3]|uniref:hypothetical protein n=1 Tax=Rhodococcus sp. 11-3 TaxID=2854796 RepID=UPI00203F0D2E|nr:hypothetical protein [Rhodococcus sp. 11-3]USC17026.1 hypothetical protein KZJ41_09240 [Rhodococcus sp. 11-3]
MASPVFVDATTATSGNAAFPVSLTHTDMPSHSVGDLLLWCLVISGNFVGLPIDMTVPDGWTLADETDATNFTERRVYWKFAGPSETAPDVTCNVGDGISSHMLSVSGVDTVSPVNAAAHNTDSGGNMYLTPSVTTTVDETLVVRLIYTQYTSSPGIAPNWPLSTRRTSVHDLEVFGSNHSAPEWAVASTATRAQAAAGSTGTESVSFSTGGSNWGGGTTVALAPATLVNKSDTDTGQSTESEFVSASVPDTDTGQATESEFVTVFYQDSILPHPKRTARIRPDSRTARIGPDRRVWTVSP